MRIDNPSLFEGSKFTNLVVASGTAFPTGFEDIGELFFRTDLVKLFVYDGTDWADATAEPGDLGSTNSISTNALNALTTDTSNVPLAIGNDQVNSAPQLIFDRESVQSRQWNGSAWVVDEFFVNKAGGNFNVGDTLSTGGNITVPGIETGVANLDFTNAFPEGSIDLVVSDISSVQNPGITVRGGGAVEVFHDGSKVFETTDAGINVLDSSGSTPILDLMDDTGTGVARFARSESGQRLFVESLVNSEPVVLRGRSSGGFGRNMLIANPDGAAELYHAGDKVFETDSIGAIVGNTTGDARLRIIADTNNVGEDNNPWIELNQDGGAVVGLVGLTQTGRLPNGAVMSGISDNTLVLANTNASYGLDFVANNQHILNLTGTQATVSQTSGYASTDTNELPLRIYTDENLAGAIAGFELSPTSGTGWRIGFATIQSEWWFAMLSGSMDTVWGVNASTRDMAFDGADWDFNVTTTTLGDTPALNISTAGVESYGYIYSPGGTYVTTNDTKTDASLVIDSGTAIYGNSGGSYLRNLLSWTSSGPITIGQSGTSLISEINLIPGNAGNNAVKVNGNTIYNAGNESSIGTEASTINTVVRRNGSGDINARLFRSEYDSTNSNINFIMTQVDTASNNYLRPSTPAQFRSSVTDGVYLPIGGKAADADLLDGINSTQFLRSNTTDTFTGGTLTVNGFLHTNDHVFADFGITGGYGDTTSTGSDWGAPIWAIGDSWVGTEAGPSSGGSNHQYGLAWYRSGHNDAISGADEGLYIFRGGTRIAAIGRLGAVFVADVTANSDERIKTDIEPITNAVNKVEQIRGVTFTRTDIDNDDRHAGVLAQEVERVLPEVVQENDGIKSVAYGNMAGLFIEAIKELSDTVKQQNNTIESLQQEIADIKKHIFE